MRRVGTTVQCLRRADEQDSSKKDPQQLEGSNSCIKKICSEGKSIKDAKTKGFSRKRLVENKEEREELWGR